METTTFCLISLLSKYNRIHYTPRETNGPLNDFTILLAHYPLLLDGHPERVFFYSSLLVEKIPLPAEEKDKIKTAAYLHDIGKFFVKDSILNKNGSLNWNQQIYIQRHTQDSVFLLSSFGFDNDILKMVLLHHGRVDGKGYPLGLEGPQIPLGAKIIAIADAFDCITSWRPYRLPISVDKALKELSDCSGAQFDPSLVEIFIEIIQNNHNDRQTVSTTP